MNNKKSPFGGIISFVIFIFIIQNFIVGGRFDFSIIFTIFALFAGLQFLGRYLKKQAMQNKDQRPNRTNTFTDYDQDYSSSSYRRKPSNEQECEYCGHMNDKEREYCENCGAQQLPADQY